MQEVKNEWKDAYSRMNNKYVNAAALELHWRKQVEALIEKVTEVSLSYERIIEKFAIETHQYVHELFKEVGKLPSNNKPHQGRNLLEEFDTDFSEIAPVRTQLGEAKQRCQILVMGLRDSYEKRKQEIETQA